MLNNFYFEQLHCVFKDFIDNSYSKVIPLYMFWSLCSNLLQEKVFQLIFHITSGLKNNGLVKSSSFWANSFFVVFCNQFLYFSDISILYIRRFAAFQMDITKYLNDEYSIMAHLLDSITWSYRLCSTIQTKVVFLIN